jgi:hypothetical protein
VFRHGSFRHQGPANTTGSKTPPASSPTEKSAPPHGDVGEKHVTETHPGKTQPHESTGVHAVHIHHMGGGKYQTYHHHDGGDVEVKHHQTADEAHQAAHESLPGEQIGDNQGRDIRDGGQDFAESLGGIGGNEVA